MVCWSQGRKLPVDVEEAKELIHAMSLLPPVLPTTDGLMQLPGRVKKTEESGWMFSVQLVRLISSWNTCRNRWYSVMSMSSSLSELMNIKWWGLGKGKNTDIVLYVKEVKGGAREFQTNQGKYCSSSRVLCLRHCRDTRQKGLIGRHKEFYKDKGCNIY